MSEFAVCKLLISHIITMSILHLINSGPFQASNRVRASSFPQALVSCPSVEGGAPQEELCSF